MPVSLRDALVFFELACFKSPEAMPKGMLKWYSWFCWWNEWSIETEFNVPLRCVQSSSDLIGRHRATLVFNAHVKLHTTFAGSICQRLAPLDVGRWNHQNSEHSITPHSCPKIWSIFWTETTHWQACLWWHNLNPSYSTFTSSRVLRENKNLTNSHDLSFVVWWPATCIRRSSMPADVIVMLERSRDLTR